MMGGGDKIGGRGNKVRTYNFIRGEIEDHTLNKKTNEVKSFMKGNFKVLFGV
jgi:protein subunit release factor A